MSTRSVIARPSNDAELAFVGRYHHSDGYPSGVGRALFALIRGHFAGDVARALTVLLEDHPAGWSNLVGADFNSKPGFPRNAFECPKRYRMADGSPDYVRWYASAEYRTPRCYCHGARREPSATVDHINAPEYGCEYAYIIDSEARILTILTVHDGPRYRLIGAFKLDGPEPDWSELDTIGRQIQGDVWQARAS